MYNSAEKTNFVSGLDVLRQKVVVWFDWIVGKWTAIQAQEQQAMIRNYKELLSFVQDGNCTASMSSEEIETLITELSNHTPAEYIQRVNYYNNQASKIYRELQACAEKTK